MKKIYFLISTIAFLIIISISLPIASTQDLSKNNVKEYDEKTKTIVTKDINLKILTNLTYLNPLYHQIGTGTDVLWAEFSLNQVNTSKQQLVDFIDFYDLKKNNEKFFKSFVVKYYSEKNETDEEGNNYTKGYWISFNSLKEIPNIGKLRIGFFSNFTKVGEKFEWIPTIDGVEVPEWAVVEVVSGSTTLTTETDFNVTIPAVNTSQAFIMHTIGADGTGSLESVGVRVYLVNETTINFYRDNNTESVYISWFVINSSDLYVQRGMQTISTLETLVDINPVNLSSSFIIPNMGTATQPGATILQRNYFTTSFINSTRINLTRGNTGTNALMSWQVVQWANASVQTGTAFLDTAREIQPVINAVNLTRSFLLVQPAFNSTTVTGRSQGIQATFLNATLLNLTRGTATNNNASISWWVIEHPNLNVQRGQYTLVTAVPQNITLSTINTSTSFATISYYSNYTSNVWGNVWATSKLTNSTNLQLQKYLGNSIYSYISWQVIDYNSSSASSPDTTAPTITLVNPTNQSEMNVNPVNFLITTDEITACNISINGAENITMTSSTNLSHTYSTNLNDATYSIIFSCIDQVGLLSSTSMSFFFLLHTSTGTGSSSSFSSEVTTISRNQTPLNNLTKIGEEKSQPKGFYLLFALILLIFGVAIYILNTTKEKNG